MPAHIQTMGDGQHLDALNTEGVDDIDVFDGVDFIPDKFAKCAPISQHDLKTSRL